MPNGKEFNEISRAIGDLEGTVRNGFYNINARYDKSEKRIDNIESRVNKNESNIDKQRGMMVMLGCGAGIAVSVATAFIKKLIGGK